MYVTRPLSLYRRDSSAASMLPPEGSNSGILVIQDPEAQPTSWFGLLNSSKVKDLPFPQNQNLQVRYSYQTGGHTHVEVNDVVFIPALDQPLSANRYYIIKRRSGFRIEERVGWRKKNDGVVSVKKVEEFKGGMQTWKRFGYFVLVKRFVLRRMDGSFVMSYEFKHLHQFRTK
ncbi:hypothetical protein LINGRAHAP2_LOCUS37316 [Linum grandiflorum]